MQLVSNKFALLEILRRLTAPLYQAPTFLFVLREEGNVFTTLNNLLINLPRLHSHEVKEQQNKLYTKI